MSFLERSFQASLRQIVSKERQSSIINHHSFLIPSIATFQLLHSRHSFVRSVFASTQSASVRNARHSSHIFLGCGLIVFHLLPSGLDDLGVQWGRGGYTNTAPVLSYADGFKTEQPSATVVLSWMATNVAVTSRSSPMERRPIANMLSRQRTVIYRTLRTAH